jgi:hypothetical protein
MSTSVPSKPEGVSAPASEQRLTRREAITGAAALAALAGLAGPIGSAFAQPKSGGKSGSPATSAPPAKAPSTPAPPPTTPATPKDAIAVDKLLRKGGSADWSLKTYVHLDSYQNVNVQNPSTGPGAGNPNAQPPVTVIPFDFQTAAIVFPALLKTATSEGTPGGVSALIKVDGKTVTSAPTWLEDLPSGSRYGKWEMRDIKGRTIDIDFETRCKSWELTFDEATANKVQWPKNGRWSSDAASSLGTQMLDKLAYVDPASPGVKAAVDKWTAGKAAQSIPPVQLAKFLAGRVLEAVQPSGNGLMTSSTGQMQGFRLTTPDATLRDARASEHDIAALLCSIYRFVGLPTRIVTAYDVTKSQGGSGGFARQSEGEIRSWVEFCVMDESVLDTKTGRPMQAWIPVDIVRQRQSSSRAPALDRVWKFFGNNEDADDLIPLAFYFHPPLNGAVAHGAPCLWGWMTTPETQKASQSIRFMASTPARTGAPRPSGGGYK